MKFFKKSEIITKDFIDLNTKLTKNFSAYEFVVSASYPEIAKNIKLCLEDFLHLRILCLSCLQPLRDQFGSISVLSGKRDQSLNQLVRGSENSDHLIGCAADVSLTYPNFTNEHVFNWVVKDSDIDFRQIIFYPDKNFIHISINSPLNSNAKEALICKDNKYITYEEYCRE
tara:strand:+ start:411 stop:923 length:513 start_codon:yes stop_codon:yes gene_type:complete